VKLGRVGSELPGSGLGRSGWRRFLHRFDWPLFGGVAVLVGIGLANLYSATARTAHAGKFDSQLVWTAIGVGCYFLVAAIDYRSLHRLAWLGLGAVLAAIAAVTIVSDPIKGSQRWLDLGGIHVQPSELAKLAVIIALARLLHDRAREELGRGELIGGLIGITVPVLLIASQPDLGTSTLLALIIGSVAALLVVRPLPLVGAAAVALALVPLLWEKMHAYQKSRVLAFLDPAADPTGAGWHTQQSIFAVGSGQVTGKGFLNATQNQLNFLPEHWTDFPFSVWAEEWGFVGSVGLLCVFAFLVLWVVNAAVRAPDRFGTAICLGVAAMLFWHVVVNVAMVVGLAPVVGVTLPFISYGGSSTVTFFVGLGLVASVSLRRQPF
jgi:rod shape determining protein RodA